MPELNSLGDSGGSTQSQASSSTSKRKRSLTTSWTKTQASELALLVEAEEQLWNSSHADYKKIKATRLVWDKIAEQMERKTEDCVNKWGSLLFNFKARCVDKTKSGGEAPTQEDIPEPYCVMGFLMDVIQKKPGLRVCSTANEVTDTSSISEQLLGVTFKRTMKPDDEWDKKAQALAEHIRNAVNEFPHLDDRFRVQLLEVMLDVQKERVNARDEAENKKVPNNDFKDFNYPEDNEPN